MLTCAVHFPASLSSEFSKKREESPVVGDFAEILVNTVSVVILCILDMLRMCQLVANAAWVLCTVLVQNIDKSQISRQHCQIGLLLTHFSTLAEKSLICTSVRAAKALSMDT